MKFTSTEIEAMIQETVLEVTHVKVPSSDFSLLDTRLNIHPADFLYIFDILEKKLNKPVANILGAYDYSVMKVCDLAKALLELPSGKE